MAEKPRRVVRKWSPEEDALMTELVSQVTVMFFGCARPLSIIKGLAALGAPPTPVRTTPTCNELDSPLSFGLPPPRRPFPLLP